MQTLLVVLSLVVSSVSSAPRYGDDGAYVGFASYVAPRSADGDKDVSADILDLSAGSPDISRRPADSSEDSSKYDEPTSVPKGTTHRYPTSRPSTEDTSIYQKPVPNRINSYLSSRPSTDEIPSYKQTSLLPKPIDPYKSSRLPSEDPSSYGQTEKQGDISHTPYQPSKGSLLSYPQRSSLKIYDVSNFNIDPQEEYRGNKVSEEPAEYYHRDKIFRQPEGAYKLSDTYKNLDIEQPISSEEDGVQLKHGYEVDSVPLGNGYEEDGAQLKNGYEEDDVQLNNGYKEDDVQLNNKYEEDGVQLKNGYEEDGVQLKNGYDEEHVEPKVTSHQSSQKYEEDEEEHHPQPYEYGYALKDVLGNSQHRHETNDGHGNVKGSYGFTDEHGLYRSVQYVADKNGFRASVLTNEPGIESKNPADVKIKVEKS